MSLSKTSKIRIGTSFGMSTSRDHIRYHSLDRKSTRLNSSHSQISYAVFCLKKKNRTINQPRPSRAQHIGGKIRKHPTYSQTQTIVQNEKISATLSCNFATRGESSFQTKFLGDTGRS